MDKNHLYESSDGVIHKCEGDQIIPSNPSTYLVWTECGKDVPADTSFKSHERATCSACLSRA